MKKLTVEEIEKKLPGYKIIGEYKNSQEKVAVKHLSCGTIWNVRIDTMTRKNRPTGCPKCSKNFMTQEKMDSILGELHYTTNDKFTNIHKKMSFTCSCGHTWSTKLGNIIYNKTRCPECLTISKRMDPTVAKEKFENILGNDYEIVSEYKRSKEKIKVLHKKCGNTYETTTMNIARGRRCPYCFGDKLKTNEQFKKEVFNLVKDEYIVLGEYKRRDLPILMKHNIESCGKTFLTTPNHFLSLHTRCPFHSSLEQKELYDFLLKNENKEIQYNNRKALGNGKELDIYIPDKNIAIEYTGLYWHSDKRISKNYHLDKLKQSEKKGIRLITIFEDEWLEKRNIVEKKLLSILKLNDNLKKIFARKCIIKEISIEEKNNFLNNNHIQGEDNSNIKLGLFYENKLISVMTFSKARAGIGHNLNKDGYYELSRFANDINYIVIGSFGKLLSYFEKNYKPKYLISYADLRWSDRNNNIYLKNNFKLKCTNKPNYWYCLGNIRYHRYSFRKTMIKERFPEIYDKALTEFQMMDKTKYNRVWDCGTLAYYKEY